jgi:undecaprenyl diphosphate synthase
MQSTSQEDGLHVAMIMDGNGRWAAARGWPRLAGHKAGATTVRRMIEAAPELGVGTLTLYAFSADNWKRPPAEVAGLFDLLQRYLRQETAELVEKGVRFTVIGRRDRLEGRLVRLIEDTERATAGGERLHVRVAIDYSSRDALLTAAAEYRGGGREELARLLGGRDVDLLIRTGGEQRLSDFLLWECAYAELWFTPVMWPEFTGGDLARAVEDFERRQRRFGGLVTVAARLG